MRRRDFIALLGAAAIARPLAARAQPQAALARIGILTNGGNPKSPLFEAFRKKMAELGYVEGRTLVTEFRSADADVDRLNDLAMGLVRIPVQVIVTDGGALVARAAQRATSTIPIVMATGPADALGLVRSLAHPGGNITGFTLRSVQPAKRFELLRELLPSVSSVGILWSAVDWQISATEQAAGALGIDLQTAQARSSEEIPAAIDKLARSGVAALIVLANALFWNQRAVIVERVAAVALPAIYPEREYAEAGGLVAYGPNVAENFRGAAVYVDRILKGENPGDLPVQEPATFDFVINLKTAKALGLTIPVSILARASEVIE
jgi:putative tryptophan/tyrosine transport system substrate-binding protein